MGLKIALLSVVLGILVSSRANDPRTAQQVGAVIVVPLPPTVKEAAAVPPKVTLLVPVVSMAGLSDHNDSFVDATLGADPGILLAGMENLLANKARMRTAPALPMKAACC